MFTTCNKKYCIPWTPVFFFGQVDTSILILEITTQTRNLIVFKTVYRCNLIAYSSIQTQPLCRDFTSTFGTSLQYYIKYYATKECLWFWT